MIFWDIDGTVRDIHSPVYGKNVVPLNWDSKTNGIDFCDYIDNNLQLLENAPPTEYYKIVCQYKKPHFLTRQPLPWIPYTTKWLKNHFENFIVDFIPEIEDKLDFIGPDDYIIDDYPKFSDYSQIILVDYPYNSHVFCKYRVKSPSELKKILAELE